MFKYPSITNHYHSKDITYWLERYPDLETAPLMLQEKIHGSNIQFTVNSSGVVEVASRNRVIEPGENFHDVWEVMKKCQPVFDYLQEVSRVLHYDFTIYGEIFGPGIQKGVYYGEEKRILFFDMKRNNTWATPYDLYDVFRKTNLIEFLVPRIGIMRLDQLMRYDTAKQSYIAEADFDNIMEGVVAKPLYQVYVNEQGSVFMIKKKNEAFKEKASEPKPPQPPDEIVEAARIIFEQYINENRVDSVISKEGPITDPKQFGNYIRLVVEDAKEDALADYPNLFYGMDRGQQGKVTNFGKEIVSILKEKL